MAEAQPHLSLDAWEAGRRERSLDAQADLFRRRLRNQGIGCLVEPVAITYDHIQRELWGTEQMPPLPDGWGQVGRRMVLENGCKVTLKEEARRGTWRRFAITVDEGELPSLEPDYLVLLCTDWPHYADVEVKQTAAGAWLLEVI